MNPTHKPPYVAFDGICTVLVLGGGKAVRALPTELELVNTKEGVGALTILPSYPVLRWIELHSIEVGAKMIPRSVKSLLSRLAADSTHEYNLNHFSKEAIMATAAKSAPAAKKAAAKTAAPAVDAKAANAKAVASRPAKAPTAAKPEAAAKPAKAPTKAGAAEAGEGRKGRPSPHALDAKIKKGVNDFKEHVREGTHRYARYELIAASVGKTVGEVLGQETSDGVAIVSKHFTSAIEAGYITLSK